jgi:Fe-S-cluster containining protein
MISRKWKKVFVISIGNTYTNRLLKFPKVFFIRRRNYMDCRIGCAACCIAPSISSAIPGMPNGKAAGVRCIQLASDNKCKIFKDKGRPAVCSSLKASQEMCGNSSEEAYQYLEELEKATSN